MIGYATRAQPPLNPMQRATNPLPDGRWFTTKRERQHLGAVLYFQGKLDESEQVRRQAVAIYRASLGAAHPDYGTAVSNLAETCRGVHKFDEAEVLFKEALEVHKKAFGESHPTVATDLNNLGVLYWDQGRLVESRAFAQQTLTIREKVLPPGHPAIAEARKGLAMVEDAL